MPLRFSKDKRVPSDSLEPKIRDRIASQGKITFADFMGLALYDPECGYYANVAVLAESRDYFTSPAAHTSFGALLAVQFERMWEVLERPKRFFVVEMGAGSGLLATDAMSYASTLSADFERSLRYVAIDRHPSRGPGGIEKIASDGVPLRNIVGCLVSNELVDAFPVHRFQVEAGLLRELFVSLDDQGELFEISGEPSTTLLATRLGERVEDMPDGSRGEVNLGIGPWMSDVSRALKRGFVLTIDYGHESDELYSARRSGGTVQTYFRHTEGSSPYRRVGRQDITAHVDFTAVMDEGRSVGLRPLELATQGDFLQRLGLAGMLDRLRRPGLAQQESDANRLAIMELVKPDGLGSFRVLVQEKGTGVRSLSEIAPSEERMSDLEVPLLGPGRLRLMEGRYPHLAWRPPEF